MGVLPTLASVARRSFVIDGTHSRILAEIHAEEIRAAPNSQVGIERFIRFAGRPWLAFAIAAFRSVVHRR